MLSNLLFWLLPRVKLGFSSGGGSSKSVTQNYSPEEAKRRAQVMDEAQRIYGNVSGGGTPAFPGAQPVAPSSETLAAENYLRGVVPSQVNTASNMYDMLNFGLTDAMYVDSNPYLQQAMGAAIRPITESYTDPNGVMAQIRQGAIQAGGLGGSRQGIAEGVAAGRYANAIGDVSSQMASEGYQQGMDFAGRSMLIGPQVMGAANIPAQSLANVGASVEGRQAEQALWDENRQLWDMNSPWMPLNNYANIVFGGGGSQGTTSTSSDQSTGQKLAGSLSGALTGASLASQFGGGAAGFMGGPASWGLVGLGALAGWL